MIATSAMNDACGGASTLLDKTVPLGEFLDEPLARAKDIENAETNEITEVDDVFETEIMKHLLDLALLDLNFLRYMRVMLWMKRLLGIFLLVRIEMILRNYYAS